MKENAGRGTMSHQEQDSSMSESFISELSKDKSFPLLFPSVLSI